MSAAPPGPPPLGLLVEQAAAVVADHGAGPVDLLGVSLGAVAAAATAARHPGLVRRLVLVAPLPEGREAGQRTVSETWRALEEADSALARRFGLSLALSPAFLATLGAPRVREPGPARPGAAGRGAGTGGHPGAGGLLPRVLAPTLVVGLTRDHLSPPHHARAVHAAIPGSRYAELDSGHAVQAERPAELARLARGFLLAGEGGGGRVPEAGPRREAAGAAGS
ncbi:alpha/beta fold hydrolase [Streptomyces hoynatensis]|uniref:Alpha/beta fold hydrolase n=1 Tax=Streptomyces hoynatensis TaxID=1141874 RepID=A0A3A9Z9K4_9ACTN|nr:alpha/beta fold hydrolase [Streptomyces hoynatensis]